MIVRDESLLLRSGNHNDHQILAFTHIEKSAGTTLIHILRHNYFGHYLDIRPMFGTGQSLISDKDIELAKIIVPKLACLGGHALVPHGVVVARHPSLRFITLVRDPIKRYLSHYIHWIEKKHISMSFEEFLAAKDMHNFQVKKIAGDDNVEMAIQILHKRFLLVGCVEQFDLFLLHLSRLLGWSFSNINYTEQNRALDAAAVAVDISNHIDQIVDNNKNDIALYDYVKNVMAPHFEQLYGTDQLKEDLIKFRNLRNRSKPQSAKRALDYLTRKLYLEPLTGVVRMLHHLPYRGSY